MWDKWADFSHNVCNAGDKSNEMFGSDGFQLSIGTEKYKVGDTKVEVSICKPCNG